MFLSYNWLKKYLSLPSSITPRDVAQKLTLATVEVESINDLGGDLKDVVVGKITAVGKHPNADRLKVCTVDVGSEKLTIVCGGSNVAENMLVAIAKIGARVRWHGEGEPITLEPATIRGVASAGMICGADEIGLLDRFPKKDEKEIVDLTVFNYAPGMPLATALGLDDVIFEIDNKALSNRPDLWGHYGIAREIAALYETELKPYETAPAGRGKGKALTTNIQSDACQRYMTVAVKNITVGESPDWLKTALTTVGIRPINTIVDIMNYVMLDCGQPLHAFDAASIADNIINVRSALDGETIELLDGKTYTLNHAHLVIATPGSILGLAGIMGGLSSSIQPATTDIVIESGTFDPTVIRAGAGKLSLRTDASMRFEKSLDPELCPIALAKAVELIKQMCPGAEIVGSPTDTYPNPPAKLTIDMPRDFFTALLGMPVPEAIAEGVLNRLGFKISAKKNDLRVTVPSWRATKDVHAAEDIAEEVARIYGYDTVPALLPSVSLTPIVHSPITVVKRACEDALAQGFGATETPSYSFISARQIAALGDEPHRYLELANPLSAERPYLRRSLAANLLEAVRENSAHAQSVHLFEIGKVFQLEFLGELERPDTEHRLPKQDTHLALAVADANDAQPFFSAKRALQTIAHVTGYALTLAPAPLQLPHHHPGRSAEILCHTTPVGAIYEVHPTIAERLGLPWRTALLELNLTTLAALAPTERHIEISLAFPPSTRDIAFMVAKQAAYDTIIATVISASPLVTSATLIDHYEGAHIAEGQKSLTVRITLAAPDHTLTSEEIDAAVSKISERLSLAHEASVR